MTGIIAAMSDVSLTRSGPPETVLPPEAPEVIEAYREALAIADPAERRRAVADLVAANPTFLAGWAELGDLAAERIDAYAAYRVGYHRGLDRLRQNGWRGSGFVRWEHETNRGFLRSLAGLQRVAAEIGETDEDERCAIFLR